MRAQSLACRIVVDSVQIAPAAQRPQGDQWLTLQDLIAAEYADAKAGHFRAELRALGRAAAKTFGIHRRSFVI
jgi:hypothetical protein